MKDTLFYGLHFQSTLLPSPVFLTIFCDADWASDVND